MRRNWVKIVGLATVAVFSAAVGALASGGFNAQQSGVHQNGGGQAGRLTIRVEQALADPANDLIPDPVVCQTVLQTGVTISSTACPGGALDFTIENTSNVPLRVTGVAPASVCSSSSGQPVCNPAGFNSDKNALDGSFVADELSGTCAASASFTAPNIIDAQGQPSNPQGNMVNSRTWPIIPAHGTLVVNGSDANALGVGLVHLANNTPQQCQSAALSIPLTVTAVAAR